MFFDIRNLVELQESTSSEEPYFEEVDNELKEIPLKLCPFVMKGNYLFRRCSCASQS